MKKKIAKAPMGRKPSSKAGIVKSKMKKVMHEFTHGELHSGSKKGPAVKSRKQAIAIGLSEARKKGAKIPKPRRTTSGPFIPTASTP